jgi:hypothetical protein
MIRKNRESGTTAVAPPELQVVVQDGQYFIEPGHIAMPRPINRTHDPSDAVLPRLAPGRQFAPYLERFLRAPRGSEAKAAVVEYMEENRLTLTDSEVDPAFIELVGRMAIFDPIEYGPLVRKIMQASENAWESSYTNARAFRHWKKGLTLLAREAKEWIKREWRKKPPIRPNRTHLWGRYLDDPDRRRAEEWKELPPDAQVRIRAGQDVSGKPIYPSYYLSCGIVPRELFFLLTQTAPRRLSPSEAVRLYLARGPLRLSWSGPTRTLRKK